MTLNEIDKISNESYHLYCDGVHLNAILSREESLKLFGDYTVASIEAGCYESYIEIKE